MPFKPNDAKDLFLQAAELPTPTARASFLNEACADNVELRSRVEVLLKSHDDPDSFLDQPAVEFDATRVLAEDSTADEEDQPGSAARTEVLARGPGRPASLDFLAPCATPGRIGKLSYYEITEVIGRGGMGIVLKALDTKLNRVVAIKVLASELAANAMAGKRFMHEAQAAAAVSHDHVVTIHAVDDEHGPPFLVMECIVGQSLQQKVDRDGALKLKEILRIGMQIASGLAAAHKQGLVHRDIKPANILLENGVERVRITDFGLARAVDDVGVTQTGQVTGTPQYMSPEQAMGDYIDHRSDLFSLGSVLYTMCTGRPAFRATNTVGVLRRVCDEVPRPIPEVNSEIPQELVAIIDKLLAKKPEDRIQTAAEVAVLLEQHLGHLQRPAMVSVPDLDTTATPPLAQPQRAGPPANSAGRSRWLFAGVPAVVILLAVIVIKITNKDGTVTEFRVPDGSKVEIINDPTSSVAKASTSALAIAPFDEKQAKAYQDVWAKQLGEPVEITNSLGMKLRLIPPGEFMMGSTDSDKQALSTEKPQHIVRLTKPFYLGAHEVTVAQFRAFVDATKHQTDAEQDGAGSGYFIDLVGKGRNPEWTWRAPGFDQTDNHPICCVSWQDAVRFCAWLSAKEGRLYRLPTEAEWEYACRAGTTTPYHFGVDWDVKKTCINSKNGSTAVGSFAANAFGLHDMHGNVYEWCADGRRSYDATQATDPIGTDGGQQIARVVRGGGWTGSATTRAARAAARFVTSAPDRPFPGLGIRVIVAIDPPGNSSSGVFAPFDVTQVTSHYALQFTGTSEEEERVEIPVLKLAETDDFTLEALVRIAGDEGPVIGNGRVHLQVFDKSWRLFTQTPEQAFFAADPVPAIDHGDRPLHIAGVRAKNQLRLFVDGKPAGTYEMAGKVPAPFSNPWKIGGKGLQAIVSEVCISSVPRYETSFTPQKRFDGDAQTLALFHFDEGQGDKLTDSSGKGNHGKILGAKWVHTDGSRIESLPANSTLPEK